MTHEQFAREKALKRLRQTPPATRNPESAELRSDEPVEPTKEEQRARLLNRLTPTQGPLQLRLFNRAIDESRENMLLAVAVISIFIPFGGFLALWPAIASKGRAGAIGVVSFFLSIVTLALFWRPIYLVIIQ
jgi:hypothetical protein